MPRYTLSLPQPIYNELDEQAKRHDRTLKDVVSMCMKFGLIALKLDQNPDSELLLRERVQENGQVATKETLIQVIW